MLDKDWHLPEKHHSFDRPESMLSVWNTKEGKVYIDADIEFRGALSLEERRKVLSFIFILIKKIDVHKMIDIVFVNFFSSSQITITFDVADVKQEHVLFDAFIEMRRVFLILRIGNVYYENKT